mgnify:CR=1 FL=1
MSKTLKIVTIKVNGQDRQKAIPSSMTLLEFLREELDLTGTKKGCDLGECGCCSVLIGGKPILSCLILAREVAGQAVTTIEGIADAGTELLVDAGGTFDAVNGTAIGEVISVLSGDVALGSDSIIGDVNRTFFIGFQTFGDMAIGGIENDSLPYQIDNSELSRITSGGDLNFTAFSNGSGLDAFLSIEAADFIAGDGSTGTDQNFGQAGSLNFTAEGDIEVLGNLNVTNAFFDTAVTLDAINLVRLDTANGGIFLSNANGSFAGDLSIFANDFIAATDQALIDIDGLSVAEIDQRLADSDGVNRPDGVIRSISLTIETTSSDVFIQNTVPGTDFDDRRGFEVGSSLTIDSGGSTDQPIVINGVIEGETGIATIDVTNIGSNPAVGSTINGCIIADPASCSTAASNMVFAGTITPKSMML